MNKDLKPIDFNQEVWLPAQIPVIHPRITFTCMDEDGVGQTNDTIGSNSLNLTIYNDDLASYVSSKRQI